VDLIQQETLKAKDKTQIDFTRTMIDPETSCFKIEEFLVSQLPELAISTGAKG
jgi:hypothetical protein